ncbi:MAG TPA: CAP domain-containing protein [Chondromyces sp.]|nr:CAP domain-containing protein [Chondromyces sp.]
MKRLLLPIVFFILLYVSWPSIEKLIFQDEQGNSLEKIESEITEIANQIDWSAVISLLKDGTNQLLGLLGVEQLPAEQHSNTPQSVDKPDLTTPSIQSFSVHNIELGDSKEKLEKLIGFERRSSMNEYGVNWHTYHQDYQNFVMAAYDNENRVAGLYTNQDLISSTKGIKRGTSKTSVREQLGNPLTRIQKGLVYYEFEENRDYDVFLLDNSYVTIFYDKHQNNTVTAIQIISEELEKARQHFYTPASPQLREGFEYQLFDLTNATRVNHGLPVLTWDDHVRSTARKHSVDMAENNYFDHTNLEGQSPFDRMEEDQLRFTVAGENLAYGQFSSIFAHEGLMNSLGHRKNILQKDFEYLGIGVAFNEQSQPYYTENFYAN